MRVAPPSLRAQCQEILKAWGLSEEHALITAERLEYADLRGIDSHGVALLPLYDRLRREGRINFQPDPRVVRTTGVTVLVDGDNGLGHFGSTQAMRLAIDKAATAGMGAAAVRNSNHFGAAGAYAVLAAEAGMIGMAFSAAWDPAIVPTFGADPLFGTNPIAVAAPAGEGELFCFDVATSTVALGKLRLAELHDQPLEPGWALDHSGAVTTDPKAALSARRLTPLGGTPRLSSHKGYGLAAVVEILSTMLSGAWYCATREARHPGEDRFNVGHFFLAIDPGAFRARGDFEADLQDMARAVRRTRPADQSRPVMLPGDPETQALAERTVHGVPLPQTLVTQLRAIAEAARAPWLLEPQ